MLERHGAGGAGRDGGGGAGAAGPRVALRSPAALHHVGLHRGVRARAAPRARPRRRDRERDHPRGVAGAGDAGRAGGGARALPARERCVGAEGDPLRVEERAPLPAHQRPRRVPVLALRAGVRPRRGVRQRRRAPVAAARVHRVPGQRRVLPAAHGAHRRVPGGALELPRLGARARLPAGAHLGLPAAAREQLHLLVPPEPPAHAHQGAPRRVVQGALRARTGARRRGPGAAALRRALREPLHPGGRPARWRRPPRRRRRRRRQGQGQG
mmetsp:Transcript_37455/g.117080  ORF Transcript_37455/g.117080 Transcript_37455/m.117080 type:complete len:269 (+) Transcript_37455:1974-2780(+)